jgi:primosomal protein N' (replication factor Y) (superfamily II helicase)
MTTTLVNIALPLPVPRSFTYSLPEHLAPFVKRGSFVLVPFGSKKLSGIVIGFPETTALAGIKPILEILDPAPIVSDGLLKLGEWMAEYYCAPLGETLRLFLPQGIGQASKRIVMLERQPTDGEFASMPAARRKIVEALLHTESLTIAQLRKSTGLASPSGMLASLASAGIIRVEEHLGPKKAKTKSERFVRLAAAAPPADVRGAKQQSTLAHLTALGPEWQPLRMVLRDTGATSAIVTALARKGAVDLADREVERMYETMPEDDAKQRAIRLNDKQQEAVDTITRAASAHTAHTFLLHGITGSGKTQVYIEALRSVLERGKTAIVLVPEISLTPQTVRRFRAHFGDSVIVMHSRMSPGERYDAWRRTRAGKYTIVIGPRSALFAPLENIGLIVVDEEHESSYKQFDAMPRYHARDAAIVRGMIEKAVVVLGSATPSLESYTNAKAGKYTLIELPDRIDTARLPEITIVNMSDEHKRRFAAAKVRAKEIGKKAFEGEFHGISKLLEDKMRERMERKEGIILLQNRRGFAPFMECDDCGFVERCDQCEVTLTYHLAKKHLRCHYCGKVKPVPVTCPQCKGPHLKMHGLGTQRVEQDVAALFPEAKLLRMDLDTTSHKGAHDTMLRQFGDGTADILLGTQMVAKGLDFSRVTLVGVISADTQMTLPDFRSAERTFQLLTQVAGRAGRSTLEGEVVIQTLQPDHYALKHVLTHDFIGFFNEEISFRQEANYPPFTRVVLAEFKGPAEQKIQHACEEFAQRLRAIYPAIAILGPAPAVIAKIMNNYRWQVLVKSDQARDKNGTQMRNAIRQVYNEMLATFGKQSGVKMIVDVDPQSTM